MVSSDPITVESKRSTGRLPHGGESLHPPKLAFRPDIEGLRALAIGAVLLYHADFPWTPGGYVGVDMFFVISGFLITRLLLREVEETSTVSLKAFYGRRMKRLLPATAFLLSAVAVLSLILHSALTQEKTAWDVVAAGAYVINWRLAAEAVDYFAAGLQASPVQHFWSLAVEEQFYIVWPVLLLVAALWWRRRASGFDRFRFLIGTLVVVLAAASFAYNIYLTHAEAGAAYFSTFTRGWEFTLGAMLALIPLSTIRFPRFVAPALAWGGLALIVCSVITLGDETPWPGTAALMPTLGTCALILAGFSERPSALQQGLGVGLMRHIGRLSYSWYLWHWPLLVFAVAAWGQISGWAKLAIAAGSYLPALLTHLWVERPVHHHKTLQRSPAKALLVGAACTAASVGVGLFLLGRVQELPTAPVAESRGARAVKNNSVPLQDKARWLRPTPEKALDDRGQLHADGCLTGFREDHPQPCEYGAKDSDTTVVLFGDSLAAQWFPGLQAIAEEREWRLVAFTKSGCAPPQYRRFLRPLKREYTECEKWRERAMDQIVDEDPALVVLSGQITIAAFDGKEKLDTETSARIVEEGYVSTLKTLKRTGAEIVLIREGPHPEREIPDCVSENPDELHKCAFSRSEATDFLPVDARAARRVGGVTVINPTPMLCNEDSCPPVIENVLVYRQTVHLTATYVESLVPWLERKLPRLAKG